MTLMDTTTTDPPAMRWPTLPDGRYAVLRCCHPDGTSSHGFTWPLTVGATVEAPDWDPNPGRDCGGGLHGLLWGCGTADLLSPQDGVWMLVAVDPADIATPHDLVPDKVRFRAGEVVHVGDKESAVGWLVDRAPGLPVVFATATAGDRGTATAGDRGTATAGDRGTATAGDWGTATAGYEGCISILRWDGKAYRRRVAEVDGTTIRAGVPYQLDADGNFVEVER